MYTVKLSTIMERFDLLNLTPGLDMAGRNVSVAEINRPGLQLAGFYDYFEEERLQLIGMVEYTYLCSLDVEVRRSIFAKLFSIGFPALILSRGLDPFDEIMEASRAHGIPVLQYTGSTSELMGELIRWLRVELAPRLMRHGVLLDVYGEGVLIVGESGIGKSETAMELIHRGHRLVADDSVEIKKVSSQTLVGCCPPMTRYFMELRGIGIIDVQRMYGVEAVKETQNIDIVIELEMWDKTKEYDRLGIQEETIEILGNQVPCARIPVRPGRNLAIICEAAAINHRQKKMGYNSGEILSQRVMDNIRSNRPHTPS